jgi:5-methylthioadenosine/S-adenosylhomocysteine deaminase
MPSPEPSSSPGAPAADLLVAGGDVVTMDGARRVLVGGTVAISGDRIVAVGATRELRAAHPRATVLDATGCVVTPGIVNGHQHISGNPLARSCTPDLLAPGVGIFEWSVPLHGAQTADDDALSATITVADSLRHGVTTLVEAGTVAHPAQVARAVEAVGGRAALGVWGWDHPGLPYSAPVDEVLDRQREVLRAHPRGGRVEGWVALVGHDLVSDELLAGAADLARSAGVGMTMHLSPTSSDPDGYARRSGKRPVIHLGDLGVLGPHLLLAHAVWIDDREVEALLGSRTAVAYTPWAYLRLGQGLTRNTRHADLVERGGRLVFGCDAMNAADHVDVLSAAGLAAGIARDTRIDPERFGAHQAFEVATIGGAEAIGMADRIGSLEPGKLADLVVHDTRSLGWTPRGDVGLQLVWGVHGTTVRDVVVGGEVVLRDGRCTRIDEDALREEAQAAQAALLARAGITIPHPWPHVDAR